jgi:hypothetical protein
MAKSRSATAQLAKQPPAEKIPPAGEQTEDKGFESKEAPGPFEAEDDQTPPPKQASEDEATKLLKKQIEDLRRSEEAERQRADQAARDREAAVREAQASKAEALKFQNAATQNQYDAITSGLAAAQAEIERAKGDIKTAIQAGDADLQTDAYGRLAEAAANAKILQDGKLELEEKAKALKEAPVKTEQPQQQGDQLDRSGLPDTAKNWLRKHPEYLTDQRKNSKIQALHWDVIDEGHKAFSPEYYESMEVHLGMREAPKVEEDDDPPQQQQRTSIVSAPVSREVPGGSAPRKNGQIKLTAEQREFARISGVTEAEYAKQLEKINTMKANGTYGDGR